MRNLAQGHSASTSLAVYALVAAQLAGSGFDDFYLLRGRGRSASVPSHTGAAGAFFGLDLERVYGRAHPELGARFEITRPPRGGLEIPAIMSSSWEGTGSFSGRRRVAEINTHSFADPNSSLAKSDRGFRARRARVRAASRSGLDTPARARVHSGVEWNEAKSRSPGSMPAPMRAFVLSPPEDRGRATPRRSPAMTFGVARDRGWRAPTARPVPKAIRLLPPLRARTRRSGSHAPRALGLASAVAR